MKRIKQILIGLLCITFFIPICGMNNVYASGTDTLEIPYEIGSGTPTVIESVDSKNFFARRDLYENNTIDVSYYKYITVTTKTNGSASFLGHTIDHEINVTVYSVPDDVELASWSGTTTKTINTSSYDKIRIELTGVGSRVMSGGSCSDTYPSIQIVGTIEIPDTSKYVIEDIASGNAYGTNATTDTYDVSDYDYVIVTISNSVTGIYNVTATFANGSGFLQTALGSTMSYFLLDGKANINTLIEPTKNTEPASSSSGTYCVKNIDKIKLCYSGNAAMGKNQYGATWTTTPTYSIQGFKSKSAAITDILANGNSCVQTNGNLTHILGKIGSAAVLKCLYCV